MFLLAGADKRLGLIDRPAALVPDKRDPAQVIHSPGDILRERVYPTACGYPDIMDVRYTEPNNPETTHDDFLGTPTL